ncbi:tryptorubin family RiPP precursor [Streptomyces sp. NPDC087300]|uniref:tryptorubin family RiPP precursor n=1 Tax=Streptomyces sp. NPDC087300 TaxID=3365780 RepID=UPI0038112E20
MCPLRQRKALRLPLPGRSRGSHPRTPDMPGMAYHLRVYQVLIGYRHAPRVQVSHVPTELTGGMCMKIVRSLKKRITGEKSLKAYAWYHWY